MSGIKSSLEFLKETFNTSKDTKEAVSKAYSTYNIIRDAVIEKDKNSKEQNGKVPRKEIDVKDIMENAESIVIRKPEDIGKVAKKKEGRANIDIREDKGER